MLAIVSLVIVQILFGVNFIASKFSLMVIDPFTFSALRFLVAGVILFFFALFFRQLRKITLREWKLIVLCSLTGVSMGQCFFMWGIKYSGAINASVVTVSIPLFTLLISYLRNQVRLTKNKVLGILGAGIGVLFLKWEDVIHWNPDSFAGDLCLVGACLSIGLFISLSKDLYQNFPAILGTSLNFLVGAIFLIPFGLSFDKIDVAQVTQSPYWESIIFSILGGTIGTYFLNNWVMKKVDPVKVSLFIYLQPIVAASLALVYLDEKLTSYKIIASLIIFASVVYAMKEKPKTVDCN